MLFRDSEVRTFLEEGNGKDLLRRFDKLSMIEQFKSDSIET